MTPSRIRHLVVAGILLATTGCSATDMEITAPTSPLPVSQWAQIDVPLARFSLSRSDWDTVYAGVVAAQNRCLARFGLSPSATLGDPMTWSDIHIVHRYGLMDRSVVEKYGSGSAPPTEKPKSMTAPTVSEMTLAEVMTGQKPDGTPSDKKDATGSTPGDGGCGAQGWQAVRDGTGFLSEEELAFLAEESWDRARTTSQFKELLKEWTTCMDKAGYPNAQKEGDKSHSSSAALSVKAAVADLTCSENVNYVGRANLIDSQIQIEIIKKNESQLRAMLASHDKLLENARREAQR